MAIEPHVVTAIKRVRAYASSQGWTKFQLAWLIKMRDLNGYERADWNPSAHTLRRLEEAIDAHASRKAAA